MLGQSTGFYIQELEGKSIIHVYTVMTVAIYIYYASIVILSVYIYSLIMVQEHQNKYLTHKYTVMLDSI